MSDRKLGALIKRYMPQTLFGRSLLIIVVPIVLMQALVATVFFDAHWRTVTARLSDGVAGDVAMVQHLAQPKTAPLAFVDLGAAVERRMGLSVAYQPGRSLPERRRVAFFTLLDQMLDKALRSRVTGPYWFDTTRYPGYVDIRVPTEGGVLRILAPREQVFSTTGHIFVFWLAATTLMLTAVSIVFIRNQVRAIERLAEAADAFGRGHEVARFKPSGALEVRRAALAFLAMKARISRHIDQRTTLLAAVSHDLRTPLTRLKLALSMMTPGPEIDALKRDVADMEAMIDEYLAFAGGVMGEDPVDIALAPLLSDVIGGRDVILICPNDLRVHVRVSAFKRAVQNLIDNAVSHASNVTMTASRAGDILTLTVDDNGPGIAPEDRAEALRPFGRLDPARNPNAKGAGLGLAIVRDVVRAHGGDVVLDDSPLGGLRVVITAPV
jgi:two-component system osmolarity sensor histidine kinase EnvZ